jgi:hypothetical protein
LLVLVLVLVLLLFFFTLKVVHGQHLVKFGQNADIFGIIDIIWIGKDPLPSVGVRVCDTFLSQKVSDKVSGFVAM